MEAEPLAGVEGSDPELSPPPGEEAQIAQITPHGSGARLGFLLGVTPSPSSARSRGAEGGGQCGGLPPVAGTGSGQKRGREPHGGGRGQKRGREPHGGGPLYMTMVTPRPHEPPPRQGRKRRCCAAPKLWAQLNYSHFPRFLGWLWADVARAKMKKQLPDRNGKEKKIRMGTKKIGLLPLGLDASRPECPGLLPLGLDASRPERPEATHNRDTKKDTDYVGLKNQGATCYMNSLLQSLYHIHPFRKAVYHMPAEDTPRRSIPFALQSLFYKLQHFNSSISTEELTDSFGWNTYDVFRQHDVHEFNKFLCAKLEDKMKGTLVDGTIAELFEGHLMSYVDCINVDYKSAKNESFYDIALDVKGCLDVYASFDKYVAVEMLEGDNMYHSEKYGLQDAKKGMLFTDLPPVLQLQLKRFEHDQTLNTMLKINNRYEFPLHLDLDRDGRKYLSPEADKSVRNLYTLHSVLVHSGGVDSGHYYAFIRPTLSDQWYKFDDERVTKEAANLALEEQYGWEEELHPGLNTNPLSTSCSNAYMLVYVRESDKEKIICDLDEGDIPEHLTTLLRKEYEYKENKKKEKAEAHTFTALKEELPKEVWIPADNKPHTSGITPTIGSQQALSNVRKASKSARTRRAEHLVVVGNLHNDVTSETLMQMFQPDEIIRRNHDDYTYLYFRRLKDAVKAITFDGVVLKGRELYIKWPGYAVLTSTLLVRGFHSSFTVERVIRLIYKYFALCGPIKRVSVPIVRPKRKVHKKIIFKTNYARLIVCDNKQFLLREKRKIRGIAFVEFESMSSVPKALLFDQCVVDRCRIDLSLAFPKEKARKESSAFCGKRTVLD